MRLQKIDLLRGLAIFFMIPANFIFTFSADNYPFWFRFCCSMAAPLFVFLSGYLVAMACELKPRGVGYYLERMAYLLGFAVFIDIFIWQLLPFHDFDVLYLLGFSAFFVYLCSRFSVGYMIAIAVGIIILGELMMVYWGFRIDVVQKSFRSLKIENWIGDNSLRRLIFDGWFPLIPWLAYGLFGGIIYKLTQVVKVENRKIQLLGFGLLIIGILSTSIWPYPTEIKMGYVDLIYPPSVAFTFTIFGVMTLMLSSIPDDFGLTFFNVLGQTSLFVYIFHLILIRYIQPKIFANPTSWLSFSLQSVLLIATTWVGCYLLQKATTSMNVNSKLLRMVIGK